MSELRLALRSLLRTPGLTGVVIGTLALGIGGTAAIFSFVDGVLLRPLPYPQPERLAMLCEVSPEQGADWCGASPSNLADWSEGSRSFESMGLARNWRLAWRRGDRIQQVEAGVATPGLFQVFSVRAALGRTLEAGDDQAGHPRVVLASHDFWRERLGADPAALGRTLDLDGEPHLLVGVLPEGFDVPELERADLWVPLWPAGPGRADYRWWRGFRPFGRLAGGVTWAAARVELEGVRSRLERQYPETNAGWGLAIEPLGDRVVRSVRGPLLAFQAAIGLVLLISCANVANLLLARATTRQREFAVRAALGAGGGQLLRPLLAEAVVFGAGGAALGGLLAFWLVDLFRGLAPASFPRLDAVHVSPAALAGTVLLGLFASLAASVAPVLHAWHTGPALALGGARGSISSRGARRMRAALGIAQLALALVLLASASLLLRSFARLADWQPGFDRQGLLTVQVFAPASKYPAAEAASVLARAVDEVRRLPSVVSAASASAGPLFGGDGRQECVVEGRPLPAEGQRPQVSWYDVGPGYFRTLGVPLRQGRAFTDADGPDAPRVAVINETLARRLFPAGDALGSRVRLLAHQMTAEVVGVVADTRPFRPELPIEPEIYWPYAQVPRFAAHLVARVQGPIEPAAAAIRIRLAALDPDLDLGRFQTLEERAQGELVAPRFNLGLVGLFAGLALALATVGTASLVAFSVSERTREIGVRMALGARPADVLALALRQGLALVGAGTTLGLLGAVAGTRVLGSMLASVSPTDPLSLGGAAAFLTVVVALACLLPARRAARVDPVVALRCD